MFLDEINLQIGIVKTVVTSQALEHLTSQRLVSIRVVREEIEMFGVVRRRCVGINRIVGQVVLLLFIVLIVAHVRVTTQQLIHIRRNRCRCGN